MAENLSALFPEFNSYRYEINTKDCLLLNIHTSSEKHLPYLDFTIIFTAQFQSGRLRSP